jgi:hypothetical protein
MSVTDEAELAAGYITGETSRQIVAHIPLHLVKLSEDYAS